MPAAALAQPAETVLQNVIFPEQGICTELDLYVHLEGRAAFAQSGPSIWLGEGASAIFDSYFNLFSLGKWASGCTLETLTLEIEAEGRFELRIWQAIPGRSWELLHSDLCAAPKPRRIRAGLSHFAAAARAGVIFFEIRALAETVFHGGRFLSGDPVRRPVRLGVAITTFRREAEVARTAARLDRYAATEAPPGTLRGFVVDNGGTARIEGLTHVARIENPNLGGAGGFARGMAEALDAGMTHCLFMDDDASFHMENLTRSRAWLALAVDPRAAVAGAMISNTHKWAIWEAGARFFEGCRPQQGGRDLRRRDQVFEMEFETAAAPPPGFYAGFWFFAFPLAEVQAWPFPFFVRGDDVSFSLANPFRPVVLGGVVSFQDDFTEKESVTTHYLDMRSHIVHHLAQERMWIGAWRTAKLPLRFIARSLSKFHYESAAAELLAWRDVMRGPEFFAQNADMARRWADLAAMTRVEVWAPRAGHRDTPRPRRAGPRWDRLLRWTLNGHFLPLPRLWAGAAVRPSGRRGDLTAVRGMRRITWERPNEDRAYTVHCSDLRCLVLLLGSFATLVAFLLGYRRLRTAYRGAYPALAAPGFWRRAFAGEGAGASGAAGAAAPVTVNGSEHVEDVEKDDDRDRNTDQPGENTFHDEPPVAVSCSQNAAPAARVPHALRRRAG